MYLINFGLSLLMLALNWQPQPLKQHNLIWFFNLKNNNGVKDEEQHTGPGARSLGREPCSWVFSNQGSNLSLLLRFTGHWIPWYSLSVKSWQEYAVSSPSFSQLPSHEVCCNPFSGLHKNKINSQKDQKK